MARRPTLRACLLAAALSVGAAMAQDDIFAFIPDGGRTILDRLQADGLPDALAQAISAKDMAAADWEPMLGQAGLDPWDAGTLAHYLAANAPLDPAGELPRDGRDMALALCQSCHIITVVITQERTREAWLGTMNSPSHVEIEMTEAERGLLADYLVLNAGIPIDQIPPELRAGGASY
jgi:hypothetical protein